MEIKIEKLDNMGRGIGYINEKVIFIPKSLPGDVIDAKITKESKKYYEGKLIKILNKSDKRIDSSCPYFDICGGCNLLNLKYEDTIEYKETKVKEVFKRFLNIDLNNINAIKSDKNLEYRNKITIHIKGGIVGLFNEKNEIFKIDICLLVSDGINNIINLIKSLNIKNAEILIRENNKNEIIISINSFEQINFDVLKVKKVVGIIVNNVVIYGNDYFVEDVNDLKFKVSYKSFFQINNSMTSKLFNIIEQHSNKGTLLDLFCGVGTLGIAASKKAKEVIGIDDQESNIKDANENKFINGIDNIKFELGDSSTFVNYIEKIDTLILDPPRAGLNKETLDNVINVLPNKIIYVSCDPFTLVRDLKELLNLYNLKETYVLDMFPYTHHVETIVILERNM